VVEENSKRTRERARGKRVEPYSRLGFAEAPAVRSESPWYDTPPYQRDIAEVPFPRPQICAPLCLLHSCQSIIVVASRILYVFDFGLGDWIEIRLGIDREERKLRDSSCPRWKQGLTPFRNHPQHHIFVKRPNENVLLHRTRPFFITKSPSPISVSDEIKNRISFFDEIKNRILRENCNYRTPNKKASQL
jgi:hypothetical protein